MKKTKIVGAIFIFIGVIGVFTTEDAVISLLVALIGVLLFFNKGRKKAPKQSAAPEATYQKPKNELEVFPAWWEKYEGVDSLIDYEKGNDEPYQGMKGKELREHLEGYDRLYEYDIITEEVYFEDEPTNEYNPEALMIMSDFGQIGYVPDKVLTRVRQILKDHPEAESEVEIVGGNYKTIEVEYGEDKIKTVRGKWSPTVYIRW